MKTKDDPTIERIRRVRHDISEKHEHDPRRIVQHYKEIQKQYQDRLLQSTETPPTPSRTAEQELLDLLDRPPQH